MLTLGCDWLETLPEQPPLTNTPPETYISIATNEVIYAKIDTVDCSAGICDTLWTYYFQGDPNLPDSGLDTIQNALQTTLTSRQTLHWWGEDPDGDVIGYYFRWNTDSGWDTTTAEDSTFIVPIRQDSNLFSFSVMAFDNDSLVDPTPAILVLPIRNTPPTITFRYRSNPVVLNANVVHWTFPTRTFVWDVADDDGLETVDSVYWALDDTSSWNALDATAYSSITLADEATPFALDGITSSSIFFADLSDTAHTFYLKAKDIAGAESPIIQYPDTSEEFEPNTWRVQPVVGDVLLVDDYAEDLYFNYTLDWYQSVMDTITGIGAGNYSVWKIGEELPFSGTDVLATLSYFEHVVWFAATAGIETYDEAGNSIYRYLQSGGNVWINVTEIGDTTLIWFPFDSIARVNPSGRFFEGKRIEHEWDSTLDLVNSLGIFYRFNSIALIDTSALDPVNGPHYQVIYRLQAPGDNDPWTGRPILAAEYHHRSLQTPNAGRVILSTIPLHNGNEDGATLEGEGSAGKFISWALRERFMK